MLAKGATILIASSIKILNFISPVHVKFVTDLNSADSNLYGERMRLQDQACPYISHFSDNSMIQWFVAYIELDTARPSPKFRDGLDVFRF